MKLSFLLFGFLSKFCSSTDITDCSAVTNIMEEEVCSSLDYDLEDLQNFVCNPIEIDNILTTLQDIHIDVSVQTGDECCQL